MIKPKEWLDPDNDGEIWVTENGFGDSETEIVFEDTTEFLEHHEGHKMERHEVVCEDGTGAIAIVCRDCDLSHWYDLISP